MVGLDYMNILAIETSCDETSLALITADYDTTTNSHRITVHNHITNSQIDIHRPYGGVFPKLAKREHAHNIIPILVTILETNTSATELVPDYSAKLEHLENLLAKEPVVFEMICSSIINLPKPDIDRICVTNGPGLEPALWVGINTAVALGYLWDIPVVPVNHMEGHILSVMAPVMNNNEKTFTIEMRDYQYPALALLISGGHTEIVNVASIGDYTIIGKTRDDAVGEAFDKVARIVGLPYPGGPEVSNLASRYDDTNPYTITLPRPMIHSGDLDFSFSGLKTAVLYAVRDFYTANNTTELPELYKIALCYEFQSAVCEVLASKITKAIQIYHPAMLVIGGGVSANTQIINTLTNLTEQSPTPIVFKKPSRELAVDNALMIALAGYFKIRNNPDALYTDIRAVGTLSL